MKLWLEESIVGLCSTIPFFSAVSRLGEEVRLEVGLCTRNRRPKG